jgi:hypothetical protein
MKPTPLRLIITAAAVIVLVVLSMPSGCKDPNDFEPGDTLVDAPAPPTAIAPQDSYLYMPTGFPFYVTLQWNVVDSAEVYQVELTRQGDSATIRNVDSSYYVIGFTDDTRFGDYLWRVRASSGHWVGGYTGWSSYYHFGVDYQPFWPMIIRPAPSESLILDSFPQPVTMEWNRVRDETKYDIMIYLDSIAYYEGSVDDTMFNYWFYEPGHFYWQVRANSQHWQMPGRWAYSDYYIVLTK